MGSRALPTECSHGTTIDWGDFGPCQDCKEHDWSDCPNIVSCDQCDAEYERATAALWTVIEEAVRGFLMEKRVGWDDLDPWTDEIVAIVRDHLSADQRTFSTGPGGAASHHQGPGPVDPSGGQVHSAATRREDDQ